ncbi:MAG: M56 family metallopeptidase [Lachnospiraceae bacterium]|nr:M56 family metallopeptidase [Lachnospiraceae bacterium]
MLNVFYRVIDIGIAALWMVIAVLILRLVFRKASSRVKCAMWGMVALRLLVPVIIESNFAITPYFSVQNIIEIGETVPETWITENMTDKNEPGKPYTDNSFVEDDRISDFDLEKQNMNDPITEKNGEKQTEYDNKSAFTDDDIRLSNNIISNDPENVIIAADNDSIPFYEHSVQGKAFLFNILGYVWLLGATAFMLYGLYRFIRLRSRLKTAVLRENEKDVYLSEYAGSPFVFGIVKPKIYMGFGLSDISAQNVIKHERMHIRHRDHLLKILAYIILAAYWFLPWVWVAFILFCRDMELACDEAVIRDMDMNGRADYSQALLECVKPHKKSFSYSVYFGENGIKRRIKNISGYKRKTVWIAIAAVMVCGIVAVILFFVVPDRSDNEDTKPGKGSESSENADITKTAELSESDSVGETHTDYDNTEPVQTGTYQNNKTLNNLHGVEYCKLISIAKADTDIGQITAGDYQEWFSKRPEIEKEAAHLNSLYFLKEDTEKKYKVFLSGDGNDIVIVKGAEVYYLKDVNWDNGRLDSPGIAMMDIDGDQDEDIVISMAGARGTGVSVRELIVVEAVTMDEVRQREYAESDSPDRKKDDQLLPFYEKEEYDLLKAEPLTDKAAYIWHASNSIFCDELTDRISVGYDQGRIGFAVDDKIIGWIHAENGKDINLAFEESNRFKNGVKYMFGEQMHFLLNEYGVKLQAQVAIYDQIMDEKGQVSHGEFIYGYYPEAEAMISFSAQTGFLINDLNIVCPQRNRLYWVDDSNVLHSDIVESELIREFGEQYREKTAVFGLGDIDGDGNNDYMVATRDVYSSDYLGYVSLYLDNEKIYEYGHPNYKLFPREVKFADLDQDGEKEIFFSFDTNANGNELQLYTVLKKNGDGWNEMTIPQNSIPQLNNAFPIVVLRGSANSGKEDVSKYVTMICQNPIGGKKDGGGIMTMVQYDIRKHYNSLLDGIWSGMDEERRKILETVADGSAFENGSAEPGIAGWGICEIKEQDGFLIAKHLIQGSGYTGDILGELYVIFDYDITGRVLVRDLQFIPWYGDSEDVYYMISHSSEGKMKDFDGKQLITKAY